MPINSTTNQPMPKSENQTEALYDVYTNMRSGEQAELRRGTPGEPFWRLLSSVGKADAHTDDLPKWQLIIQCIAISGYSSTRFGKALKQAGYSQARLKRLLEADDDMLDGILRRTARQLKSANQKANWNDIRRLLFDYKGKDAERMRLRIAQDYYTHDNISNDTAQDDDTDA